MKKPKMIMFDYGQTLIAESEFDGEAGTRAILKYASQNPNQVSAKQVQDFAKTLNRDIGRYDPDVRKALMIEVHNHLFQNYLYEYFDLQFSLTKEEIEQVFWNHASKGKATHHIEEFLDFLRSQGIRTAVISNISYSGKALEERLHALLPTHRFEFVLATSEYVFRKPHSRIFELALRKAKLNPGEVWYCGDNAYFDVEGSYKSGVFPIWYQGAMEKHNRALTQIDSMKISDWLELQHYIETCE